MAHSAADKDTINRALWVFYATAALVGIATLYSAPWWLQTFLPPAAAAAFVFNPEFLAMGGIVVGALYLLDAMLFAVVFLDGRWRESTRTLDIVTTAFWTAAMLWLILVPRIFLSPTTDQATKDWLGVVLLLVLVGSIPKFLRVMRRS